jgi:hypothetical protein
MPLRFFGAVAQTAGVSAEKYGIFGKQGGQVLTINFWST